MERTLLKDRDWKSIENRLCLVKEFTPMAGKVEKREVVSLTPDAPFASVRLKLCSGEELTGFITHKTDFAMLWAAFHEKTEVPGTRFASQSIADETFNPMALVENEEVWLRWTQTNYVSVVRLFGKFLPRLVVMVSLSGFFEIICEKKDEQHPPALVSWTPSVMRQDPRPFIIS
jgi:hypothetical protein